MGCAVELPQAISELGKEVQRVEEVYVFLEIVRVCRDPGKSRGLVRAGDRQDPTRVYQFVSANRAEHRVATMCRVLDVSTSGYYRWRKRSASAHATADRDLLRMIRTVHQSSRGTCGAPRIHAELRERGIAVSRKRVARLMRSAGIAGVSRRRWIVTTKRASGRRAAPDLVQRDFTARRPDQLWVADITYVPTGAGFLYLAVVLDAWSRKIVGWALHRSLREALRAGTTRTAATRPSGPVAHRVREQAPLVHGEGTVTGCRVAPGEPNCSP